MISPGIYRHFKGHLYQVLLTAKHTETEEEMVVYRDSEAQVGVRPASMWNEDVVRDGKIYKRFTKVE